MLWQVIQQDNEWNEQKLSFTFAHLADAFIQSETGYNWAVEG